MEREIVKKTKITIVKEEVMPAGNVSIKIYIDDLGSKQHTSASATSPSKDVYARLKALIASSVYDLLGDFKKTPPDSAEQAPE